MSGLSDFKKQVQSSVSVPSWGGTHAKTLSTPTSGLSTPLSTPSSSAPAIAKPLATPSAAGTDVKKKKNKHSAVVFSQPRDKGTGSNINTQLVYAVDYLRSQVNPMRLEDIAILSRTPLLDNPALLTAFNSHPDVVIDPKTNLYKFKREITVRSPDELLREIRHRGQEGAGISIKQLKETFPTAPQVIEDFEKQGLVLVTRGGKEGQMKFVFWNEIPQESGGKQIESEFRELWDNLNVPPEADILKSLEQDGLQATMTEALPTKQLPNKKKGKKSRATNRQTKITNTHLPGIDLSKDYVKPSA